MQRRADAVGHHHECPWTLGEGSLDLRICHRVQVTGGFVQNHQPGWREVGADEGNELPLTRG